MDQENVYIQRLNLVFNYIRDYLTDDLSLAKLADVASFSPFHFHRLFKSLTGETVNEVVMRLRLERAATLLKTAPTMPILQVALSCGFNSASSFSRAFRRQYGLTARDWDRVMPLKNSKNGQVLEGFPRYHLDELHDIAGSDEMEVRIRELPEQRMAYLRVSNSYVPERVVTAYERLKAWYAARGGKASQTKLFGMSQDDPDITPLRLCRYDWCVSIPSDWQGSGPVSTRLFPACHVAYIHCEGDIYSVDRAWQYLYRYWLPRSRFQPANLPAMEIYRREPAELGWERYDLDCAVPIAAL